MALEQRAAVTGVTGFIGRGLPGWLAENGFAVTGVSRAGEGEVPGVDRWQTPDALDFSGHAAVIHLAGEPINQRWTDAAKIRFRESRIHSTRQVVEAIRRLSPENRPKVLVSGSAVGFYGDRGDEFLTEESAPGGGFLADLCRDWESEAFVAESLGLRVVTLRTGMVLGRDGGAFQQLHPIFKWALGGKLGNGRQWMPWIHLDDLRAAIVHAVISESLSGPINGSSPSPERNADFTRKFSAALHRPAFFTVPAFALKILLGEFSKALLASQRAVPSALVADGFEFQFPALEQAFVDLLESA